MRQDHTLTKCTLTQSIPDEVEHGHLDDALARLGVSASSNDDAKMLAFLYTQRGDYDRAVELLSTPRWSGALDAYGLQLRANAEWRAGRLQDALTDFDSAQHVAATAAEGGGAIAADIAVLREEVVLMTQVDRSLTRLDVGYGFALGLIALMILESHRRLVARLRLTAS
jgi:hypothetical protein